MRLRIKKNQEGFTLVELMIVVAIVGVLAALAIYGVSKYLANAKTAEARNGVGQIANDAVTAYMKDSMGGSVLALGASRSVGHVLCGTAPSVPASLTPIKGQKYQSKPTEWSGNTWDCLGFSMNDPQWYQYGYAASGTTGVAGETFTVTAAGDLDGDGNPSSFVVGGSIKAGSDGSLVATKNPNIVETNPEE